jgi:hypothetical protein
VEDDVDVVNMSFQYGSCDPDEDRGSVNATLRDVLDSDVFVVAASGNGATSLSDACGVNWPGNRPEVMAAVGLNTSDDTVPYVDTNVGINCAAKLGGMPITSHSGTSSTATVLGLAAPGWVTSMLGTPPQGYSSGCGSSFASPIVTGASADLRDLFREIGWDAANDARAIYANMALLGDAWNGNDVTTPGGSVRLSSRASRLSGYGRLRMRWPQSGGVTGPWYWHWQPYTVDQDEVISVNVNGTGAEPSGTTEYKVVVVWFPEDLSDVSDVDVKLVDTCAGGGTLASQTDYDYHNRLRIPGSSVSGRCLQVQLTGFSIPAGGQKVYLAEMYHGGTL